MFVQGPKFCRKESGRAIGADQRFLLDCLNGLDCLDAMD